VRCCTNPASRSSTPFSRPPPSCHWFLRCRTAHPWRWRSSATRVSSESAPTWAEDGPSAAPLDDLNGTGGSAAHRRLATEAPVCSPDPCSGRIHRT
jgi:hypothetical protein